MEFLGIVAADHHGEGVFIAQGLRDFEVETLRIALLDTLIDIGGIGGWRFVQHGRQCGTGVLNVEVEFAGLQRFLAEKRASEVSFALDMDAGAGLNVLGEEFGEHDLFSEKFGADGDFQVWRDDSQRSGSVKGCIAARGGKGGASV